MFNVVQANFLTETLFWDLRLETLHQCNHFKNVDLPIFLLLYFLGFILWALFSISCAVEISLKPLGEKNNLLNNSHILHYTSCIILYNVFSKRIQVHSTTYAWYET